MGHYEAEKLVAKRTGGHEQNTPTELSKTHRQK
jgi:hypothetical protein